MSESDSEYRASDEDDDEEEDEDADVESEEGSEEEASVEEEEAVPRKRGGKGSAAGAKAAKRVRVQHQAEKEEEEEAPATAVKSTPAAAKTPIGSIRMTPGSGAKESMHRALGLTPLPGKSRSPGTAPASILRGSHKGELTGEAAQYAARDAERFPFLLPDKIRRVPSLLEPSCLAVGFGSCSRAHCRDASGKRPGEPGYNPRTLLVPDDFLRKGNGGKPISEGQRQWWAFKSQHFDSVLLFKMGKFYELFEMDAHVGVEVLGLAYMKASGQGWVGALESSGSKRPPPATCCCRATSPMRASPRPTT